MNTCTWLFSDVHQFKTGSHQNMLQKHQNVNKNPSQLHMQISQQAFNTLSNQNYTFIHPLPPASLSTTFMCFLRVSKSLFIELLSRLLSLFIEKRGGVFPLLFAMLPIYSRELAQFPIFLVFFPDSHISMSLLGLSLPSQWI